MENLVNVADPRDLSYQINREKAIGELLKLTPAQLDRKLRLDLQATPIRDDHNMSTKLVGELGNAQYIPQSVKGILDSTSGTTGNVLIRQDLNFGATQE